MAFLSKLCGGAVACDESRPNLRFAIALRNWFREQNLVVRSLNVLTEDVHARRSRLLFQGALGKDIKVGIIALPNPDYDWRHWWRYMRA